MGYALIWPEPEHLRRILRGDCTPVRLGNTPKDPAKEVLRFRPSRLGMRKIATPQHRLDADLVAHLHAELVFHELDEHVALPVIARQQALARLPALGENRPLAIGEVHLLQPVRDPCGLVLDRASLQSRKTVEYAGKYHRGQT